jgi:hypothetical protein
VPTLHELKCWPDGFAALRDGRKRADFRRDDRGFQVGDHLWQREWDPGSGDYTGDELLFLVTDIQRGPDWGIPVGYVMMSLAEAVQRPVEEVLRELWQAKPAGHVYLGLWVTKRQAVQIGALLRKES